MNSGEVEKNLDVARNQLQLKEGTLVKKKEAFIQKVQAILPNNIERGITQIISRNAGLVQKLPAVELATMKKALAEEKPKAIEKGVSSLRSNNWMWCPPPSTSTGRDPISWSGVNEDGPIWLSLQSYSGNLEGILKKYGLKVEEQVVTYSRSPFWVRIPRGAGENKEELEELSRAVAEASKEYCDAKLKVTSLERELEETKARERYESV